MRVLGVDFTSAPRRGKPITCLPCTLADGILQAGPLAEMTTFEHFEQMLRAPGPWIAGIDFPFGQSRKFVENVGWPGTWAGYVAHVQRLGRQGFCDALTVYRASRSYGDKEHKRETDQAAGSISPQKLYGVPVALMFFEGATRLLAAGVTIPYLQAGDPDRVVIEAYPGVLARQLIGRRGYKNDTRKKQSESQRESRRAMLAKITSGGLEDAFGLAVEAPAELADDPSGDRLDALLCAIQAAWAWNRRDERYGAPETVDPLEGWIADPTLITV
jgi:hypothetical protein